METHTAIYLYLLFDLVDFLEQKSFELIALVIFLLAYNNSSHISFLLWVTPGAILSVLSLLLAAVIPPRHSPAQEKSNVAGNPASGVDPPLAPNYIPIFGHLPLLCRPSYTKIVEKLGIITIKFSKRTAVVITSPSLIEKALSFPNAVLDTRTPTYNWQQSELGIPARFYTEYLHLQRNFAVIDSTYFQTEPHSTKLIGTVLFKLQEELPNFVTFMESVVDQMPWERSSDIEVTNGKDGDLAAEANLFTLIRNFTVHILLITLLGPSHLNSLPEFASDLETYTTYRALLSTGLPRWFPYVTLTAAHLARKRLIDALTTFHSSASLDEPELSPPLRNRIAMGTLSDLPLSIQARATLCLLSDLYAQTVPSISHTIADLIQDSEAHSMLREGLPHLVQATQPPLVFELPEPPRVKFSFAGLRNPRFLYPRCLPTGKIAGFQRFWALARESFSISSEAKYGQQPVTYRIQKGVLVHLWLPERGANPGSSIPVSGESADTSISQGNELRMLAKFGCNTTDFTRTISMAFIAGILALFEMKSVSTVGSRQVGNIRIRRRKLD